MEKSPQKFHRKISSKNFVQKNRQKNFTEKVLINFVHFTPNPNARNTQITRIIRFYGQSDSENESNSETLRISKFQNFKISEPLKPQKNGKMD